MVSERSPRVVITGVGALTPLGNSFNEIGDALQAGQSGIDWYEAGTFGRLQKHAAASDNPNSFLLFRIINFQVDIRISQSICSRSNHELLNTR